MKVYFYTRSVLTLIASCLLYFVARDVLVVPDVHAQSQSVVDVNIVQVAGARINNNGMVSYEGFLPVKMIK
jgi:hypothetical protein